MPLKIDTSTEFGKRVQYQLETETIIWLTTVDGDGRPYPSPVWFVYEDDGSVLIYSRPNQTKLRNIAANARVALNFDSEDKGSRVTIFDGAAVIDESAKAVSERADYLEKYRDRIPTLDMTNETYSQTYTVAIRVVLQSVRGF